MAITWPSGGPPASGIDFRTMFLKETLIPNKKWILEAQLGSSQTMYGAGNGQKWPVMAQNWPSGSSTGSDIDFRIDMVEATLIPNKKWMPGAQFGTSGTM